MVLYKWIFLKGHELNRNVFSSIFLVHNHHLTVFDSTVPRHFYCRFTDAQCLFSYQIFFHTKAPATRSSEMEIRKACIYTACHFNKNFL